MLQEVCVFCGLRLDSTRAAGTIPARTMAGEVVGREQELAAVSTFLDRPVEGLAAFVLEGEPGIGKSTIWLAAVEAARERGLLVLSSRPAEAERLLAHVVLGDLFEPVLDEVLPALTAPRRHALEAALLRDETPEDPVDPRALGVAIRTSLEVLSRDRPLVLAVDDEQWIDTSSASVLRFAIRRLSDERILLLLARRLDERADAPALEEIIDPGGVERLHVGPLSMGAMHVLMQRLLGRTFPRPTLLRLQEVSGGNPFYALELARGLGAESAIHDPTEPFPLPESLERLVRGRLSRLDAATREALLLVAAHGRPSPEFLRTADVAPETLDPARDARVVELSDGVLHFTHPLLASAVYQDASREERRRAHGRLAVVVVDPLDRARHLALSTETPDARIAGVLEETAALAGTRAAPIAAAELAEHALRLTPPEAHADRNHRALGAARAQRNAGEWTRARSILFDLLSETRAGPLRAEALVLLAELESERGATALLEEALREAASHPALQSVIHCRLAWTSSRPGFDHARRALELADELDDDVLRGRARAMQTIIDWFAAEAEAPEDLPARVRDFPSAAGGELLVREATLAVVNTLAPLPRRDDARASLESAYEEWRERDEPRSARALWGLAWVEFWAGRWAQAAEYAARARDISVQYGLEMPQDHLPSAVIAVHRGQLDLAREHAVRGLDLAYDQFGGRPVQFMGVLGLVARWSGDPSVAEQWFKKADRRASELGWAEPSVRWWTADHAELLLEDGRIDDAVRVVDVWGADAARVAREWVLAHVTRCRGLVAAAEAEVDRAASLLEQAVAQHEAVGDPYGAARALLALGIVQRRERKKRGARETIEAALDGFERLGATTWVEKARSELGRIGGRKREEGLTAAERRVATLVAEGRTNREVAAALFVTERTVASHLSHVYAKLGVRSRTELARRLR
jgi:DNA-binding CsgD family transcriptional regulator